MATKAGLEKGAADFVDDPGEDALIDHSSLLNQRHDVSQGQDASSPDD
jgi:hypothetical protein